MIEINHEIMEALEMLSNAIYKHSLGKIQSIILDEKGAGLFFAYQDHGAMVATSSGHIIIETKKF